MIVKCMKRGGLIQFIGRISKINTLVYLFLTKDKYDNERFNRIIKNAKMASYTVIEKSTKEYCVIKMCVVKYFSCPTRYRTVYAFKEYYKRKN